METTILYRFIFPRKPFKEEADLHAKVLTTLSYYHDLMVIREGQPIQAFPVAMDQGLQKQLGLKETLWHGEQDLRIHSGYRKSG